MPYTELIIQIQLEKKLSAMSNEGGRPLKEALR